MSRESIPDPPRRPAMSLKPGPVDPVPEETARVARAAFRKGNPLLELRDELGAVFADADQQYRGFSRSGPRPGQRLRSLTRTREPYGRRLVSVRIGPVSYRS